MLCQPFSRPHGEHLFVGMIQIYSQFAHTIPSKSLWNELDNKNTLLSFNVFIPYTV